MAFPTETVYGLGANALDAGAVAEIYRVKGRPADNPLIAHCCDIEMIERIAVVRTDEERRLLERMPAPLTIVLQKKEIVPEIVTAGLNTVAVRIPENETARALIAAAGVPLAAPSANTSSRPSPTTAEHVYQDMAGKIPLILDGGPCAYGLESTVVRLTADGPVILRRGAFPEEEIVKITGRPVAAASDSETGEADGAARSPGMRHKHYAPRCRVIFIEPEDGAAGDADGQTAYIHKKIIETYFDCVQNNFKTGILGLERDEAIFRGLARNMGLPRIEIIPLGNDENEAAQNLFGIFRACENDFDVLICGAFPNGGIGLAFNDRVRRAAGQS